MVTTQLVFFILAAALSTSKGFENFERLQLWTCKGSNANDGQKWYYDSKDNTIKLSSDNSKCFDIDGYGTTDGSTVQIFDCHTEDKDPTHQNQEWNMNHDGTFVNPESNKCLQASAVNEVGASIIISTCTGSPQQVWIINQDMTFRLKGNQNLCIDVGSRANCTEEPFNSYPYCNSTMDVEARTEDLLNRLLLIDKVSLMQNDHAGVPRLGVPPFGHTECTHGTLNDGTILTTLFPQAITFARSFNKILVHDIARAISDEVRAKHNTANAMGKYNYPFGLICWAPVVNICRDPRWGRCQEGYGEDPYLQAQLGMQYVYGLQNSPNSSYIEAVATCKHFDVHAGPENIPVSRGSFDAVVSYRDWIETFQPAFKACNSAGVMSYMCSYNAINGVPSCANYELLTEITRETWGFEGFVVSDCGAVGNVFSQHHFARSDVEAAVFCSKAGCDWNCGSEFSHLYDAVQQGLIDEHFINTSVSRLIRAMMALGVLDPPDKVNFHQLDMSVVDKHVPLNRQAAQQSIVLMKNVNNFLPTDFSKFTSVAIIGPCADDPDCSKGDYDPASKYVVTVKQAFTTSTKLKVNYVEGCSDVKCADNSKFSDAVAAAKASDLIVYVGGISRSMEGEGNDRSTIVLPGHQPDLISMLQNVSKPMIIILFHGAPVISTVYDKASVILSAGYGGQEMGNALMDVMNGTYNPSGRTVVTWYANDQQFPPITNYTMVNRTYRYLQGTPMYYFGYGLSYTTFNYSNLTVSPMTFQACETVHGGFEVQNIGKVPGDEVAQVYMSFKNSTVPVPNIKLVAFEHLSNLQPAGAKATVQFSIEPDHMTIVRDGDFHEMIEPGQYHLFIGGHQPGDTNAPGNILTTMFTITGKTVPIESCD